MKRPTKKPACPAWLLQAVRERYEEATAKGWQNTTSPQDESKEKS